MTSTSIERNTEKFEKLPDSYKEAIKNTDYDGSIAKIAKKNKLHIDQSAYLEDVLSALIFGEISGDNIISEIKSKLSVDKENADTIAKDINELILHPIKENLMKMETKQDEE